MKDLVKKLICFCILIFAVTSVSFAQKAKVVSSYGPVNQDVTFDYRKY